MICKKNVARQMVIGGNIQYQFPVLKLGITGFSYSLDKSRLSLIQTICYIRVCWQTLFNC